MYDNIFFSIEQNNKYSNNEISFYLEDIKRTFGNWVKIIF